MTPGFAAVGTGIFDLDNTLDSHSAGASARLAQPETAA